MRIMYITGASFRQPNAAALRNIGLASALAMAGHEVVILTPDAGSQPQALWFPGLPEGVQIAAVGVDGDEGFSWARLGALAGRSHPGLDALMSTWKPDVFLVYQSFLPLLVSVRRQARRLMAPMVLDITEWYDGASLPYGVLGPHNVLNQLSMRAVVPRFSAAITVSTGLAAHVSRRGARTFVVPPLFEPSALDAARLGASSGSDRVRIAVVGSGITPGQKDRAGLLAMAAVADSMDPTGDIFDVQVAGPTLEAVETALGGPAPKSFTVRGPLTWARSLDLVGSADFSLVMREDGVRRNRLGFPSKVPESLLLGTPILGNAVGDLGAYLVDGHNAAIVKDTSATSLQSTLERTLGQMGDWDRACIKSEAERWFTPRAYAEPLGAFLNDARGLK